MKLLHQATRGRVRRLLLFCRTHGWAQGLYRAWHGVSRRFLGSTVQFTIVEIMAAPVTQLRRLPRVPRALQVREAHAADQAALEEILGQPGKAASRLAARDTCLLASSNGRILATEWIKLGPATYDEDLATVGVVFGIPANACWLYDGRTVDDEQVIGPWGAVMGRLPIYLQQLGVETVYLQVGHHNPYSLACHRSLGFRSIGRLSYVQVFGWRFVNQRGVTGPWSRVTGKEYDLRQLPLAFLPPPEATTSQPSVSGFSHQQEERIG